MPFLTFQADKVFHLLHLICDFSSSISTCFCQCRSKYLADFNFDINFHSLCSPPPNFSALWKAHNVRKRRFTALKRFFFLFILASKQLGSPWEQCYWLKDTHFLHCFSLLLVLYLQFVLLIHFPRVFLIIVHNTWAKYLTLFLIMIWVVEAIERI